MIVQTTHPALTKILPYQNSAPVDVVRTAKEVFGLNVWSDQMDAGISGKLMPDQINGGPSGYSVIVNGKEPYYRQRFTVAHEIAHFVLHRQQIQLIASGITDDVFYRSTLSNAQEAEANRFAADVLMPYALIESLIAGGTSSVPALASALQVSETAMTVRLGIPIP